MYAFGCQCNFGDPLREGLAGRVFARTAPTLIRALTPKPKPSTRRGRSRHLCFGQARVSATYVSNRRRADPVPGSFGWRILRQRAEQSRSRRGPLRATALASCTRRRQCGPAIGEPHREEIELAATRRPTEHRALGIVVDGACQPRRQRTIGPGEA